LSVQSPAGTGDLRVKALMHFYANIFRESDAILEYMDGGGGRKGANHMYRGARADGLTIGAMSSSVISLNIMRESGVLYDLDRFIYLGAPESVGHQAIYTRGELGLNSLEKLRAASGLRIGAQSVGHVFLHRWPFLRLFDRLQGSQIHRRLYRAGS
jgi:tripartite-type tricarboxylate transporter receptor subunit TctC